MSVLIATPVRCAEAFPATVSAGYSEKLRELSHALAGVETYPHTIYFAVDVVRARNRIVGIVLRDFPTVTNVLWWDDDVWPENIAIVREMLATGEDVIAAPYTNKRQPMRWIHQPLDPSPPEVDGLWEVRWVGFGFTMTSRRCLERMTAEHRKYTDAPNTHKIANLFGQTYYRPPYGLEPEDDTLMSEDFSFCQRWRDMGGRVSVYTRAGVLVHAGPHGWSAREMPGGIVG